MFFGTQLLLTMWKLLGGSALVLLVLLLVGHRKCRAMW
jgi:hypothetical protein